MARYSQAEITKNNCQLYSGSGEKSVIIQVRKARRGYSAQTNINELNSFTNSIAERILANAITKHLLCTIDRVLASLQVSQGCVLKLRRYY
jgi:hypothetical protein